MALMIFMGKGVACFEAEDHAWTNHALNMMIHIWCTCTFDAHVHLMRMHGQLSWRYSYGKNFFHKMWFSFLLLMNYNLPILIILSSPRKNDNKLEALWHHLRAQHVTGNSKWKSLQNFLLWIVHKLAWSIQHGDKCTTLHALSEWL